MVIVQYIKNGITKLLATQARALMVFHYLKSYIDTQHQMFPPSFIILKILWIPTIIYHHISCPSYHLRNSHLISLLLPNTLFSRAIFYTISTVVFFKIKILPSHSMPTWPSTCPNLPNLKNSYSTAFQLVNILIFRAFLDIQQNWKEDRVHTPFLFPHTDLSHIINSQPEWYISYNW